MNDRRRHRSRSIYARTRLIRQLLTESVLLAVTGGALGLLLAYGVVAGFARVNSAALPQFSLVQVNGGVLAFTFALSLVTGLLFGMMPAWQVSRPGLCEELKGGAGSTVSPGRRRRFVSNALVAAEIALSVLLLVCAGLLLKDFVRLRATDIGVRTGGVWTAAIQLPNATYRERPQQVQFAQALAGHGALHQEIAFLAGGNVPVCLRMHEAQSGEISHPVW